MDSEGCAGGDWAAMTATEALLADIRGRLKDKVGGPDVVFGFVVDNEVYALEVVGGVPTISAVPFLPGDVAVTITMTRDTLLGIMEHRLAPPLAYMTGQLKVKGPVAVARRLGDFFL